MARKNAALADSDQIKDQVFSELQSLIEESEKLLNDSAALVGEEAETLRAQVSLKLRQARQAADRAPDNRGVGRDMITSRATHGPHGKDQRARG